MNIFITHNKNRIDIRFIIEHNGKIAEIRHLQLWQPRLWELYSKKCIHGTYVTNIGPITFWTARADRKDCV